MIRMSIQRLGTRTALVLLLVMALAGHAMALAPSWMPGFPLRAGATVILMWTPVPGGTGYKLLKKVGAGEFKEIYSGPGNSFNDPDAPAVNTIEYKIISQVGGKDGDVSQSVILKGVEPIKSPEFTGVLPQGDAVSIRWTLPRGAMFFNLYKSEKKEGPFALLGSFQQDTYVDRNLKKGVPYFYQVSAIDQNNTESAKSAVIEALLVEEVKAAAAAVQKLVKVTPRGTTRGEDMYEIENPYDIAVSKAGEVYILEKTSVQVLDKDGKYLRRINYEKEWTPPSALTFDRDGAMLMTFYAEGLVRKVDETGKVLKVITYPVPTKEDDPSMRVTANNPNSVAVDGDGNYWIADSITGRLVKLRPAEPKDEVLAFLGRIPGTYANKDVKLSDLPSLGLVYFDPFGNRIYAGMVTSTQIAVIDPNANKVLSKFAGMGGTPDKFMGLSGIVFRPNGNILVLDGMMQVVKEFDKDYKYLATYVERDDKAPFCLLANFSSRFAFREDIKRLYIVATLGNMVYMYDLP